MKISIVSPVYNAEKTLNQLVDKILENIPKDFDDYEIILVDDYSRDNSWKVLKKLAENNTKIKALALSRNFGQHYAITAGLDEVSSEWVVVMDCDLQDRPEEIPKLYEATLGGFDIVLARRKERQDSYFKRLSSKIFYKTLGYLTGTQQDEAIANFGIYHCKVIDAIKTMRESIRYFPSMVRWVGFKSTSVNVEHNDCQEGKTNYNLSKLIKLALDIILAYSDKLIIMFTKFGMIISCLSILVALYFLLEWFFGHILVPGYASLIISLWFLSGIIITSLGVVGLYIGKIFEGVKNRPLYIIAKKINCE